MSEESKKPEDDASIMGNDPWSKPSLQEFEEKEEVKQEVRDYSGLLPQARPRSGIYSSVFDLIGGTPLIRLSKFKAQYNLEVDILAKCEMFNPLGSMKDRTAFAMIAAGERLDGITPETHTIIEATSGNMAVSLAFVCGVKGYRLILCMPQSVSLERKKLLQFLGAELVFTPSENGMRGAMDKVNTMMSEDESLYVINQFENEAAVAVHAETLAEEIWADTAGAVDCVICGVGTGASYMGLRRRLKEKKPDIEIYAVEPKESAVLSGQNPGPHRIQGIGSGTVPPFIDSDKDLEGIFQVTDADAFRLAQEVSKLEGITCGISSGANLWAAIEAARLDKNQRKTLVVILGSAAERYQDSPLFEGK